MIEITRDRAYTKIAILSTTLYFSHDRLICVAKDGHATRCSFHFGDSGNNAESERRHDTAMNDDTKNLEVLYFKEGAEFNAEVLKLLSSSKRLVQAESIIRNFRAGVGMSTETLDKFEKEQS